MSLFSFGKHTQGLFQAHDGNAEGILKGLISNFQFVKKIHEWEAAHPKPLARIVDHKPSCQLHPINYISHVSTRSTVKPLLCEN